MSGKVFIDSNILIYAHDIEQKTKCPIARDVVLDLVRTRNAVVSPQVLQEFYVNATRKIARPLTRSTARQIVEDYRVWSVDTVPADIMTAFRIEDEAKISFWDALICASALKAGATAIVSEDLNAGQKIAGFRVVNPFR
jgi:predicted nucleic acid-binding protein